MIPRRVLYYGADQPLPLQRSLHAGPLTMVYDVDPAFGGNLRYIRLGDREVLRRVYVAVRDEDWGTIPATLSNLQVEAGDDAFHITFDVTHRQGEIDFFWQGVISGDAQGQLSFAMEGEARSTFLRNRIGFCVLHPMRECAGQPCAVEHTDGSIEHGEFPEFIAPHQPFLNVCAISHSVFPGISATVRFHGDIFEMEDQRNWTDASYKTYSTPLALPMPVEVETGTRITQRVELQLKGNPPESLRKDVSSRVVCVVGEAPTHPVPQIGLGVAGHGQPLSRDEQLRLEALNLSHLRVKLDLTGAGYERALEQATADARALDLPLEVALVLSDAAEEELQALARLLERVRPTVCAWLVFNVLEEPPSADRIRLARKHLESYAPTAQFGSGTDSYFTTLNRNPPALEGVDLVTYSLNPQVHAFDNQSLVEAAETQAVTVASARRIAGDLPLSLGPITLKPRPESDTPAEPDTLPSPVDVRQLSLFGAGWTAASLKYVMESGVFRVTYYETTGWLGVMERPTGSPLPDQFPSLPGSVFLLYHVLADLGEFAGGEVIPVRSSDTLRLDAWAVGKEGKRRVVVANLTNDLQTVTLQNVSGVATVRYLDENSSEAAMLAPEVFRQAPGIRQQTQGGELDLSLQPYAVARIDVDDR